MTSESFGRLPALHDQYRKGVFEATNERLDTLASYVEKDFWGCLVIGALYNRLPEDHPWLLFKGGATLSKAFGPFHRFSEDIDQSVCREVLDFADLGPQVLRWPLEQTTQGTVRQVERCLRSLHWR